MGIDFAPDSAPANELISGGPDTDSESKSRDRENEGRGRVGLLVSGNYEHLIQKFLSYKTEHVGTSQVTDHCLDSVTLRLHGRCRECQR